MDSRLSPALMEDLSLVTENGLRQSLDDQTVCGTPHPLAASTVARDAFKQRELSLADPRGSFINTVPNNPSPQDIDFMKLTFNGSDGSDKAESRQRELSLADPRGSFINTVPNNPSPQDIDFMKLTFNGSDGSDKAESRSDEMGCNDISARSSLGLIPVEAMNDLSSSALLLNNLSKMKPSSDLRENRYTPPNQQSSLTSRYTPSNQLSCLSGQSTGNSNDWRDSSKQDSKNHAIGSSHIVDTVKKRPACESALGNKPGAVAMSLFGGGLLGEVSEGCEMDASVHDVEFAADELQLLDEDFSDLEELSTDEDDFGEVGRKQKTLTDDDKLGVNTDPAGNRGNSDQRSNEDRQSAVGEESWNLDQRYFQVCPPVYSKNNEESRTTFDGMSRYIEDVTNPFSDTADVRYCDKEATDDGRMFSTSSKHQYGLQRPGLEGECVERQSGEGEVSDSGDSEADGDDTLEENLTSGAGAGDGSSGPDSDNSYPRHFPSNASPQKLYQNDSPEEERLRPMGNDLLTDSQIVRYLAPSKQTPPSFLVDDSLQVDDGRSSFQLEDILKQQEVEDSGRFVEDSGRFESSERMGAFGYNAADYPQGDDPFGNFNSSFGSFGLNSGSPPDTLKPGHGASMFSSSDAVEFQQTSRDISNNKYDSSNQSRETSDPTLHNSENQNRTSIQTKSSNQSKSRESSTKTRNSSVRTDSRNLDSTNRSVAGRASTGSRAERQSGNGASGVKSRPSMERQNMPSLNSSSKFHTSMSSSNLDSSSKPTTASRRSNSLHRSGSLPKVNHRLSDTTSQNKVQGETRRVSGRSSRPDVSGRSSRPETGTPTVFVSTSQQKSQDFKIPKPIASIGRPQSAVSSSQPIKSDASLSKHKPVMTKTNLALHASFVEEAEKQKKLFESPEVNIAEADFLSADAGLQMFDEDEKEFNKENIFSEHDNMSASTGTNAQWEYRSVISQSICTVSDDPWDQINRLSVGEYWLRGTENLGTLEGNPDLPRPEFGMKIKTPPNNRKPMPLFKTTDHQPLSDIGNKTYDQPHDSSSIVSDLTFTLSDLGTPQQKPPAPRTSHASKQDDIFSPVKTDPKSQESSINEKNDSKTWDSASSEDSGSQNSSKELSVLTQTLMNLEKSLSDQSGLMSLSAISSFISKNTSQVDATELAKTLMTLTELKYKAQHADKAAKIAFEQNQDAKQDTSNKTLTTEIPKDKSSDKRSRLPMRRESQKELIEKTMKAQLVRNTPSPPVSKPVSGTSRSANVTSNPSKLSDAAKQEMKPPGSILTDSYSDDDWQKLNNPDRETGYHSDHNLRSPERQQGTSTEWRSPRPSLGGRHHLMPDIQARTQFVPSKATQQSNVQKAKDQARLSNEKQVRLSNENQARSSENQARLSNENKARLFNENQARLSNENQTRLSNEKRLNELPPNSAISVSDLCRPSDEVLKVEVQTHPERDIVKDNRKSESRRSYESQNNLNFEKSRLTDENQDKSDSSKNEAEIRKLSRKSKSQNESKSISANDTPANINIQANRLPNHHQDNMSYDFLSNRTSSFAPLQTDISTNQNVSSIHSYPTKDVVTNQNQDNNRHSDHHIPDGCDYSSRSNYFSPDKDMSRDSAVGTDDIRLSDSRGFKVLRSNQIPVNQSCDQQYRQSMPELKLNKPDESIPTPTPISTFHHGLLPQQQPDVPTLMTDQSLLKTEFAQKYFKKDAGFKVPFPVRDKPQIDATDDSIWSDETTFYELEAQDLSRMSHVMVDPTTHLPQSQSTPFMRRDGMGLSMPAMTPGYMKSILSTGPIDRRFGETDCSHLETSSLPMATPKQLTALEVQSVLTLPHTTCVGIPLTACLPIGNPTSRWQECILHVKDLSINNQLVDPEKLSPFEMKTKIIVEPKSQENISILFLPRIPGAYVAQLLIYAKPFLRDRTFAPSRIPVEVTIQAIAESPNIQVITKEERKVSFGQMQWGSCRSSSIQLRNLNKGSLPIRLTIASTNRMWQCFSFDKDGHSDVMKGSRPGSPVFGKNAMSLCLEGYGEEILSSVEDIQIYCKAPYKQADRALSHNPPEVFEGRIIIEIDTTIPNVAPLASISLRAEFGVAKLHLAVGQDNIKFSCFNGKKCSQNSRLRNAGNIDLEVSIFVPQFADIFRVIPKFLMIPPHQEKEVAIYFEPKDPKIFHYDSILLMGLEPDGPTYELALHGEVQHEIVTPNGPLLLSDKNSLSFGGVTLGKSKQLKATLKSNANQTLKLRVEIRSKSLAFRLSEQSGSKELCKDLVIKPQEKIPIEVVYSPTEVDSDVGKLVIKPYDCNAKFCLSLSGYGGTSSVLLEDVNQSGSRCYWIDVGEVIVGNSGMNRLTVRNSGHRAAFVKALAFTDLQLKQTLPPGRIAVEPNEFVLEKNESKVVHVAFCPSDREVAVCYRDREVVATVAFYSGDEVSRQKYRRSLNKPVKPGRKNLRLPENIILQKVNFDVSYCGDDSVKVIAEGETIGSTESDIDLFYSNLSRVPLALIGHPVVKVLTTTPQVHAKSKRSIGGSETMPHVSDRSSIDSRLGYTSYQPGEKESDWSVLPQQLICNVYREGKKSQTGHFQIVNFSVKDIKFELSWPGHWFSVSPGTGIVKAKSNKLVTISPVPNINVSKLPWSGAVVVCCNDRFEEVKVQLRNEANIPTADSSPSAVIPVSSNQMSESLNKSKDIEKHLDVPTTHFVYPKTPVGDHCGKILEFTNKSTDTITWLIESFAPAYAKGIDKSSDIYRVTYSVFVIKEKTGQLAPEQTAKVPLMFVPRSDGTFTQCWDLQCFKHPSITENSMTVKISLVGEAGRSDEQVEDNLSIFDDKSDDDVKERPITIKNKDVSFKSREGEKGNAVKIEFQNNSDQIHSMKVVAPQPPFYIKHHRFNIGKWKFLKYPVDFRPEMSGLYESVITFKTDIGYSLNVRLHGECLSSSKDR